MLREAFRSSLPNAARKSLTNVHLLLDHRRHRFLLLLLFFFFFVSLFTFVIDTAKTILSAREKKNTADIFVHINCSYLSQSCFNIQAQQLQVRECLKRKKQSFLYFGFEISSESIFACNICVSY
jgi:hypothetical protein